MGTVARYRRAKPLVCYWAGGRLVLRNYHTGLQCYLPPLASDLLAFCADWRTLGEIRRRFDAFPAGSVRALVQLLARQTFLDSAPRGGAEQDGFDLWKDWMPEGAFFHFGTKDVEYAEPEVIQRELVRKIRREPPPPPLKRYPGSRRKLLPPADTALPVYDVLRERRTWRRFDTRSSLALCDTATLLGLTWGVQKWVTTALGRVALKTSPSGGARHPNEVYVLAQRVEGLSPGWYHYEGDSHVLERVAPAAPIGGYLPRQRGYRSAAALFVMTAVFARTQWAYKSARAYRVVLLDAGHLAQTFCLLATALGLAPFCSAALADSKIERDLGLDGISEAVTYACGVGARPPDAAWAPWPDKTETPEVTPPIWAKAVRKR